VTRILTSDRSRSGACSRPGGATTATRHSAQASPPPAGATLGAPPPKPVAAQIPGVARVNGEVDQQNFDRAAALSAGRRTVPAEQDQILRGVLDQIVSWKLLVQESRARKVAADVPKWTRIK
jgi:hypothetical protein